ncbi:MAG TPA: bifunctional sulfate adenylyltransferase/adenylylsulfate kinase [Thermoplasmata archaeon]|nr:bifunctional sulfate adenylyltransferase/adenylylsulfate kinase [Thermoplasmata archaeon]
MDELVLPHGGRLAVRMAGPDRKAELTAVLHELPFWDLTARQQHDLGLILNGGFSPLQGFLDERDYASVVDRMRLADSRLWPIPVVLDVDQNAGERLSKGERLALRDPEGMILAVMNISAVWQPDRELEAQAVFGSTDMNHAGVRYLLRDTGTYYVGGDVEGLEEPAYHTFRDLRQSPSELRRLFEGRGWSRIVAFQTRNPMHRVHYELTRRAMERLDAKLLLHPVVGPTKPGDLDSYVRIRGYRALLGHYPTDSAILSLLPLAMRMAGPREAVWHAIIRKNYGCTHIIVGRDHAGPGNGPDGNPYYAPYAAQEMMRDCEEEVGVRMVPFEELVYVPEVNGYVPAGDVQHGASPLTLSGTDLRHRLERGLPIPDWFSFPEVVAELRSAYPERSERGLVLFFTGLPAAGKSTLAKALLAKLMERDHRSATLLDGDIARKFLSSELGFSRAHRDLNILRLGFVATEVARARGIAICSAIAPYDSTRKAVREMASQSGGFVLVHVATPTEVCEQRDRKGNYAKARKGLTKGFTGIDDPYEVPSDAEVVLDLTERSPENAAEEILRYLIAEGYVRRTGA